jgi:hypothetical protein
MTFGQDWTRRDFLQNGSIVVPTLKRMLAGNAAATVGQDEMGGPLDPGRFAPVELSSHFNASPSDFGPREPAKAMGGLSQQDGLIHTPSGKQNFRGIPFLLGSEGSQAKSSQAKSWIVLSQHRDRPWAAETVEIVVDQKAGSICLAQFCDWDANETPIAEQDVCERVGQRLADIVFVYDDGREEALPIRRRFEGKCSFGGLGPLELCGAGAHS